MKRYTIGIYFNDIFTEVLFIHKNRPEWQKDKINVPGGTMEEFEESIDCIIREFIEECCLHTSESDWKLIGEMSNENLNYMVDIYTAVQTKHHGVAGTGEDQKVFWHSITNFPNKIITNLKWMIPFALNYWDKGLNEDNLVFCSIDYK